MRSASRSPAWVPAVAGMEGEQRYLRGAADADVKTAIADAPADEEGYTPVHTHAHSQVARQVAQGEQRADPRQADLAAVRVTGQDQTGMVSLQAQRHVGAVRQHERTGLARHAGHG